MAKSNTLEKIYTANLKNYRAEEGGGWSAATTLFKVKVDTANEKVFLQKRQRQFWSSGSKNSVSETRQFSSLNQPNFV